MAVQALEGDLATARREIRRLEDEVAAGKTREQSLGRQIQERDRTIAELRGLLERCKDYDDIVAALARRTTELALKMKECDELGEKIKDLRKELDREIEKNTALKMRVETVLKQRDRMMEEAEAREKLLKAELDEVTTKFNRLMAAGGGKKTGGESMRTGR